VNVWEPPTKQFYPKRQSPRVLPSSHSAWSIAAPSCTGSRPASRQSIRDGHPERQAVSDPALSPLVPPTARRSRYVTATKMNRPDRRPVEIAPLFIPYQLPAAALSRSTTNIWCGVRDPTNERKVVGGIQILLIVLTKFSKI
jgi:hypothetical protein